MNKRSISLYEELGRSPVHPFPARMAPGIVSDILKHKRKSLRILDPMAGSGTVLALVQSKGHKAVGFDLDPLAVLISKVWTTPVEVNSIRKDASTVLKSAQKYLGSLRSATAFPSKADQQTKDFILYWFDLKARKELTALARSISRTRCAISRSVLWCAFSRLIITKQAGASLAMDLAHSRPHKVFVRAPISPLEKFSHSVEQVLKNCINSLEGAAVVDVRIDEGDARQLRLRSKSIDVVLTSPPYLNAIDYIRCSKFSLVWMGYKISQLSDVRARIVGCEVGENDIQDGTRRLIKRLKLQPALSPRHYAILARYIADMKKSISEVCRVLVPGGRAIYVIGENTVRGTFVRNSVVLSELAKEEGLKLIGRTQRVLPNNRRYLPPPDRRKSKISFDTRMRKEVVLVFQKPR